MKFTPTRELKQVSDWGKKELWMGLNLWAAQTQESYHAVFNQYPQYLHNADNY